VLGAFLPFCDSGKMSFRHSVIAIGPTSPGCARANDGAASTRDPRNASCSFLSPASDGHPPRAKVTVDSPGQP